MLTLRSKLFRRPLPSALAAASLLCAALTGCSSAGKYITAAPSAAPAEARITVHGGQQPVAGATIQLYAVGTTGDGSPATPLILTTLTSSDGTGNATNTNANAGNGFNSFPTGAFNITGFFTCPQSNPLVYLTATGGNPGLAAGTNNQQLALLAALGACSSITTSTFVAINELTTVGSLAALYPFTSGYAAVGSGTSDASQLATAFANVNKYVNVNTGQAPGPALPPSTYASTTELITLADAIAPCVNSAGGTASDGATACGLLLGYAASGNTPTDTVGAITNILKNPTNNTCPIFNLVGTMPPFQTPLASCPSTFALPISPVTIAVSGPAFVYANQTAQYTAAVTGTTNQNVTWQVNGVTGGSASTGTISSTGLYTSPATGPQTITITAVSTIVPSASGSLSITAAAITVAVNGPWVVLYGNSAQYTATVTGSSNTGVTWTVNGVAGGSPTEGTISSTGIYTAPQTTPPSPVVIGATSAAASSAVGSLAITVSPTALSYATGNPNTVIQPVYPTVCATLTAQFSISQRSSPPAASADDTARIQAALNSSACKNTGKTVELMASGSNDTFFSEQLAVNGEGVLIDQGVTLAAGATNSSQSYLLYIKGTNSSVMGLGTIDGRGDLLPNTNLTRLVEATSIQNFTAYQITLKESIGPNLYMEGGANHLVWGITIRTPATRPNADGIDVDSLSNTTVINSSVEAGDDGVAVKTNSAAASNITVQNNKFYGTHGISIGSQTYRGVTNILFTGNTLYGPDLLGNISGNSNGINIKTDPTCGGAVNTVTYQNTCLTGVKHLIILNTAYGTCSGTPGTPVFSNIIVNGVQAVNSASGAYSQVNGSSSTSPINAYLAYISLDKTTLGGNTPSQNASVALDQSNLVPAGNNITTTTFQTPGSVPACTF